MDRVADFESEGCRFESYRARFPTKDYDKSGSDPNSLAHALPSFHAENLDIASLVGAWAQLSEECKRCVIEIIKANPRTCLALLDRKSFIFNCHQSLTVGFASIPAC